VHGGLAEAIAFANATRYRNGETAQWDGTLAAKPTKAGQARDIGSTPGVARLTSQDGGRRNVPFDGSRAGLQSGEVFTDRVAKRTRCSFGVWAAAEGSASWHIEEARQARQWFDDRKIIHHSHHGGVKPLGARTLGPRKKTGRVANAETEKVREREATTSSRTNETRVLVIEAADGRNRSHASRGRDMQRGNALCETCALVVGLCG